MSDNTKRYLAWVIVVVAILAAGALGVIYPIPEPPAPLGVQLQSAEGETNFTNLAVEGYATVGGDLTVGDHLYVTDVAIDDDLVVTDDLSVDGDTDLGGALNVWGNLSSTSGAVTVTDDIYVTGAMQILGTISNPSASITIADHVDIQNTLQYGTANLYPVGAEDSNFQWSWGSDVITGSLAVTHKVGTPTVAWCTLNQNPVNANGNVCTTLIAGSTVTVSVWLSNSTASAAGVKVGWLVIGVP